jgi:hypothetical protein
MSTHPTNPDVFANAAWGLMHDAALSDAAYDAGLRLEPSSVLWHLQMAQFYELLRHSRDEKQVARRELAARLRAFHLENSTERAFQQLWEIRQCAAATGDSATHSLLREADQVGSRAMRVSRLNVDQQDHLLHIVRGLVALAEGDVSGATSELFSSVVSNFGDEPPNLALAAALLHRASSASAVAEYLQQCSERCAVFAELLHEASAAIRRGETVELRSLVSPDSKEPTESVGQQVKPK